MTGTASFRTLDDWLPWLETLSPREIVLGLERVEAVLGRLGISRPKLVITISGTNGKGSCLAMLDALLRQSGVRTGAYSSPHVHRYNERTSIDGQPASDDAIIAALETVEAARGDTPLTFFEFGTLATLVAFDAAAAEAWLLEVGMGGRLDAVNAVEPDGSLITNVTLDHCSWLGNDVESIAAEKAGIMRREKPVVFGSTTVPDAIPAMAAKTGAELLLLGRDFRLCVRDDGRWSWRGRRHALDDLPMPALGGNVQYRNAAAVLALLEAVGAEVALRPVAVSEALSTVRLEGRFQHLGSRWILDVAHNPAAAAVLAERMVAMAGQRKVHVVVGMLDDKDVEGFIAPLEAIASSFVAVSIGGSRGASADKLARRIANASGRPCLIEPNLDAALSATTARLGDDSVALVTGSFYVVGPAIRWLERHAAGAGNTD